MKKRKGKSKSKSKCKKVYSDWFDDSMKEMLSDEEPSYDSIVKEIKSKRKKFKTSDKHITDTISSDSIEGSLKSSKSLDDVSESIYKVENK